MNLFLWLLVAFFCFAVAFLLSGMEVGVFSLNRFRIRQRLRAGDRRAGLLLEYLQNPEHFFWTILIGNTLANFVLVVLLVLGLRQAWADQPVLFWLTFGLSAFLLYALGDLLPKLLFQRIPNRLCLSLAKPFRILDTMLHPLVALVTRFAQLLLYWTGGSIYSGRIFGSREELKGIMQESAQGFTSEERAMINRVLDLESTRIGQLAKPIDKAFTVSTQTPMEEVLQLCRKHQVTRLPVWYEDGRQRRIVGIVSMKTVLYRSDINPSHRAGDYVKPALYLDEDLRLEQALPRMQRSGQRLAIVLGRDRREVGLLSFQDVLKIMFGDVSL